MRSFGKIILLLLPLLLPSCVQEVWPDGGMTEEIVIPFGAPVATDVVVSTKGTLTNPKLENCIYNMYVFVFKDGTTDAAKEKIFGYYYDERNLNLGSGDYWTVTNNDTADPWNGKTHGTIHLRTLKESGCTIVAICNIDSEMVNISPESLGLVGNYAQLKELEATLNQRILSRNGYFPMCGEITGADFSNDSYIGGTMELKRLDAKIKFNVRADNTKNIIQNFTPKSWQVINVPAVSYVLPHKDADDNDIDAASTAQYFFDSEATVFETETLQTDPDIKYTSGSRISIHGFSFYMMENRKAPTDTPKDEHGADADWSYKIRELQNKDASGKLTGGFTNANPLATYVILKGRLEIKAGTSTKFVDAQYVIHLGNFTANPGDFNVERNHTYTYNIFILDVEHIRVEVQDDAHPENEPGATGDILISEGGAITCDSHYSTHSLVFYENEIVTDKLNWWVSTPFNPDGADPKEVNLSGIDYKWVEFRVNADKRETDKTYTEKAWTSYKPHGADAVTSDKYTYIVNPNQEGNPYTDPEDPSKKISPTLHLNELIDFLAAAKAGTVSIPDEGDPLFDNGGKIVVTAFINEYYYETNPLTGQFEKDLWKKFVNQPMRTMCILSKVEVSPDKESRVISSSFTIQQYSIQSVYNVNHEELYSGWGSEYTVDLREKKSEKKDYTKAAGYVNRDNTDYYNGRKNSMIEWGMLGGDALSWSTFLDMSGDNDSPLMKSDYAYPRYSCMSRNRDNDGNGVIDKDEIRWYMGASNQLRGMFLGAYGIDAAARLYQRTAEEKAESATYMQHILASNRSTDSGHYSDRNARIVWAEQGMTGSQRSASNATSFGVRCLRNLGYDPSTQKDITYSGEDVVPEELIQVKRYIKGQDTEYSGGWTNNVYYIFDCTRVNERSLRYYSEQELMLHDENSEAACLYKRFQTTAAVDNPSVPTEYRGTKELNDYLDANNNINPFCPEGYRLPNIREAGLIIYFLDAAEALKYIGDGSRVPTRTYWSFGDVGSRKGSGWGWLANKTKLLMYTGLGDQKAQYFRCVKDVKVD